MDIRKAIKKAIDENSFIARTDLDFGEGRTLIRPTNSSDCCIVVYQREGARKRRQIKCWNPTADDLLSTNWEVIKE